MPLRELASRSQFSHFKVLTNNYYLRAIPSELKHLVRGVKAIGYLLVALISPIILFLLAGMQVKRYKKFVEEKPDLADVSTIDETTYHYQSKRKYK